MRSFCALHRLLVALVLGLLLVGTTGVTAHAQEPPPDLGIVDITAEGQDITVTVVAPPELRGTAVTIGSFVVEIDGELIPPTVEQVAGEELDVVLLVDVSGSMTVEALAAAKASGEAFVRQLPAQSRVAVVSFGDEAVLVQPFTTAVDDVVRTLDSLEAGGETALHAAVVAAARQFDPTRDSVRTVVLLSDGGNTVDDSSLGNAQTALIASGATLHAVSIETEEANEAELDSLADATGGTVARVERVDEIQGLYGAIADDLGNQYRLRFTATGEGEKVATVVARIQDRTLAQTTLVLTLPVAAAQPSEPDRPAVQPAPKPLQAPVQRETTAPLTGTVEAPSRTTLKWLSIGAVAASVAIIGMLLLTPGEQRNQGVKPSERFTAGVTPAEKRSGVRWVASRLTHGVEALLSGRRIGPWVSGLLDTAGWKMRNSEFVLLVGLVALIAFFGGAIRSFLLGVTLLLLVVGVVALLLALMVSRRRSAFASQLNGTLQMMAGALRTGYSLPQVISLVAQEAEAPTSEEFSRMAVEMRLGRDLVDAARAVGDRMGNADFLWTTGAIDIARDVGGDLAEVLDNVGATVRTRERVRRQIQALSAEGRISAWILIGLPFPIFFWQMLVNRSYTMLLFTDSLGRMIFFSGAGLLIFGTFWLRSQIQIEY